jgi:molybdenum cofactor cytidylyltransferase
VLAAGFDQLLVVTGHDSIAVQQALSGLPVNYVHNPDYQTGQASSLVCGLEHLPQTDSAVLIALGDMPAMDPEMISALCASHQNTANSFAQITLPTFSAHDDQDKLVRGNPTIWSQPFFEALKRLEGDQGGRQILSDYPAHIQHMHWPDRYVFADVDDPDSFGHVSQYLDKKIRSMGEKK